MDTSPRLGAEDNALDAEDIADIHRLEIGVHVLADIFAADIRLNLTLAIHHVNKGSLAHDAAAHHAPRNADGLALQLIEMIQDIRRSMGAVKARDGIGIASLFAILCQLRTANLLLLTVLRLFKRQFFCHVGFLFLHQFHEKICIYSAISITFRRRAPPGVCAITISPTCAPMSAAPTGDSLESLPFIGSDSDVPTMV